MSTTVGEYLERQARFAKRLAATGLAGGLVVSRGGGTYDRSGDVLYLTGHYQPYVYLPENPPRWSGRSHTAFLIKADGGGALCVSVKREHGHGPLAADDVRSGGDFVETVIATARDLELSRGQVGLVGLDALPGSLWDRLRAGLPEVVFVQADEELAALRRIKSEAEVELIRAASTMGRRAVTAFLGALKPGVTESEAVSAAVASVVADGGAVYLATSSSGPWTWSYTTTPLPGYGTRRLEEGDLVRFDLVSVLAGYFSDFGRTVVVGDPSLAQQRLLDALHAGLDAAIAAVRPGALARDVAAAGNAALAERGVALGLEEDGELQAAYPPHWGHGLGLGWERPWFVEDEDLVLETGMYLALERALTADGVGSAAAEQNLLVLEGGPEVLTEGPEGRWS